MKTLTFTEIEFTKKKVEKQIINVFHDAPAWLYPREFYKPCPICNKTIVETSDEKCCIVQLEDKEVWPMHLNCFEKLEDKLF